MRRLHPVAAPAEKIVSPFQRACAKAHLKVTPQRLQIYRELVLAADHPSAEILHSRLRAAMPTLSLDTVYRTLATLEKHQLIKRVQTVHAQTRYEAKMDRHHHFICRNCENVLDFIWPAIDQHALPEEIGHLGAVLDRTVTVSGICRECLTADNPIPDKDEP
jgi:Fur family transcriptional regulator, peroxide stress response regulator